MKTIFCFALWLALLGGVQADPFWERLREARPSLARRHLSRPPQPLQQALLAYYEGRPDQAWALVRQLEASYRPGQQPPEFFWLRALLLRHDNWDLAVKNLEGLVDGPLAWEAHSMLAEGWMAQNPALAQKHWDLAVRAAQVRSEPSVALRLAISQARLLSLQGRWREAQVVLLTARALAEQAQLPALAARVEHLRAETQSRLSEWDLFAQTCARALEWARRSGEGDQAPTIAAFWVDQELARRSDRAALRRCQAGLEQAAKGFQGAPRWLLVQQQARLEALGLNQVDAALQRLEQLAREIDSPRHRLEVLITRAQLTPARQRERRRQAIQTLLAAYEQLHLQADDPLQKGRNSWWVALADSFLPEQPEQAYAYFLKARQQADTPSARLQVVNAQLSRFSSHSALPWARRSLNELLELLRQIPLDADAGRLLRTQMLSLRSGENQLARLLILDETRPAPESPSLLLLQELLANRPLLEQMEEQLRQQLTQARDDRERAQAYWQRAEFLLAQGRSGEAGLALQRGLEAADRGGWTRTQAHLSRMLGDAYWSLGLMAPAEQSLARAESLYQTSANARDQQLAQECRILRGYYRLRQAQPEAARELIQGLDSPWACFLRARCWLAQNQKEQALHELERFRFEDRLFEVGRKLYLARCSPREAALQVYAEAYRESDDIGSLTVRNVALEWMALLGTDDPSARSLRERTSERFLQLIEEYPANLRQRLLEEPSTQRLLGRQPSSTASNGEDSRHSRQEFLREATALLQRYPQLDTQLACPPREMLEFQRELASGQALVQYFLSPTDLYVMAVDRHNARLLAVAVESSQVELWIRELRSALESGRELPQRSARRLHALLLDSLGYPAETHLQILPQGLLWYLPWDALLDRQGRYACESYTLSCISAAELWRPRPTLAKAERSLPVLALGGASPELPATRQEALQVSTSLGEGKALLDGQATRENLERWAPQAQILHLAAHSALGSDLNQSFIQLSDGKLTVEDIYALPLRPGATVVLSSCQSALGQKYPGREVASLASAFLSSGAAQVVSALWKVEDEHSADFFRSFYARLAEGRTPVQALREARLEQKDRLPVSAWAAYQLTGYRSAEPVDPLPKD